MISMYRSNGAVRASPHPTRAAPGYVNIGA